MSENTQRQPASQVLAAAMSGAVIVNTPDGNSIVLTAECAEALATQLPDLAALAKSAVLNGGNDDEAQ